MSQLTPKDAIPKDMEFIHFNRDETRSSLSGENNQWKRSAALRCLPYRACSTPFNASPRDSKNWKSVIRCIAARPGSLSVDGVVPEYAYESVFDIGIVDNPSLFCGRALMVKFSTTAEGTTEGAEDGSIDARNGPGEKWTLRPHPSCSMSCCSSSSGKSFHPSPSPHASCSSCRCLPILPCCCRCAL